MTDSPLPPPPPPLPPLPPPPRAGSGLSRPALLVLSYLGILGLVPLLLEPRDKEVQFHARQGLLLFGLWIAAFWAVGVMGSVFGLFWAMEPLLSIAYLIVAVVGIVKALHGDRLVLPGITDLANRL